MTVKHRGVLLAAACLASLSLAACGQGNSEKAGGNPLENIAASNQNNLTEKFNAYTAGYNQLIDNSWGVAKKFQDYQEVDLPSQSPDETIHFPENISNLERAIESIKQGRAIKGGNASRDADAAADKLIAAGEALLAQWKDLAPYYSSRAYRDDALAKGKAAHQPLMTAYANAVAAIEEFDAVLSARQRQIAEQRLKDFRKAGRNAEADLVEAMNLADHFTTAAIENKVAEADAMLPQFQAAVTKLRQTTDAMEATNPNKVEFGSITSNLERLIGHWRDFKQEGREFYIERIVSNYNSAINNMDDVEMPG